MMAYVGDGVAEGSHILSNLIDSIIHVIVSRSLSLWCSIKLGDIAFFLSCVNEILEVRQGIFPLFLLSLLVSILMQEIQCCCFNCLIVVR